MSRQGAVASFSSDGGGYAPLLEPVEQAPQLRTENGDVREACKKRVQRVQHDPPRTDGVDGQSQADEQSFEVEGARFRNFTPHHVYVIDQ